MTTAKMKEKLCGHSSADVISMLENGRIVEGSTHEALVAKRGSYFRMFEDQL